MNLWLGKKESGDYEFGKYKKYWKPNIGFGAVDWVATFYHTDFEHITGIKLKPGEICRVKSIKMLLEKK